MCTSYLTGTKLIALSLEHEMQGLAHSNEPTSSLFKEIYRLNMIPQQLSAVVSANENAVVEVLSANTDVFVLLCAHLWKSKWNSIKLYMDTFSNDRDKLIGINKTVETHKGVIPSLIGLHALSGCDTVPMMFGIGKSKALKAVNEVPLNFIGNKDSDIGYIIQEGFGFVAQCYGQSNKGSSENRHIIWMKKTDSAKNCQKHQLLKAYPQLMKPSRRSSSEHIIMQLCGTTVSQEFFPQMNPCDHGWGKNED